MQSLAFAAHLAWVFHSFKPFHNGRLEYPSDEVLLTFQNIRVEVSWAI